MRPRAAALAFALALPSAATAQETALDPRPMCIDWAAVGDLDYEGFRPIGDGWHGWFDLRMRVTRPVWHARRAEALTVSIESHALAYPFRRWIVFRGKTASGEWRYVGMAGVASGRDGRSFIAIRYPLDARTRYLDWRPDGYERFLRPIHLIEEFDPSPFQAEDAEPGYTEVNNGRRTVLRGIYLEDLPELLASVPADACRR